MKLLDLTMNNDTQYQPTPECITTFGDDLSSTTNIFLTSFDAIVIPLIIIANLLSMIGIIKTKRIKYLPSQILFILLFLSDLTFGIVQIPLQIYLLWKKGEPTCLEIQIRAFSIIFPLCVSGTNLFIISVDRYIYVGHDSFYKRIVSNKILAVAIFLILAVSFTWAIMDIVLANTLDIKILSQYLVALSAYEGTILVLIVFFNISLLRNVKMKRRNASIKRKPDHRLTKTIIIIVAVMVITYLPSILTLNITGYALLYSADRNFTQNLSEALTWSMVPFQLNAALNSVVYITRNGRIKRYYKRLFMCQNMEKQLPVSKYSKGYSYKVGHTVSTCSLANSLNMEIRSSLQSNLHSKISNMNQKPES